MIATEYYPIAGSTVDQLTSHKVERAAQFKVDLDKCNLDSGLFLDDITDDVPRIAQAVTRTATIDQRVLYALHNARKAQWHNIDLDHDD